MAKKRDFKRVLVMSDLHCGHRVGLTPPDWQTAVIGGKATSNTRKYHRVQVALWDEFKKIIKVLKPIDRLIVNGDCIDGRGERSGGTELIATDRLDQVKMASHVINHCKADKVVLTRGTPYHTGNKEEWEDILAEMVGAIKIGDHEWYDVNGVCFDVKHHIGSSSIPHGRHTAIARDKMWNDIWAGYKMQPRGEIILRGHVHYFSITGGVDWVGYTLPALQGMGSKYGAKVCSGLIHWGLIWFDVYNKPRKTGKRWEMGKHIVGIKSQKATVTKL